MQVCVRERMIAYVCVVGVGVGFQCACGYGFKYGLIRWGKLRIE